MSLPIDLVLPALVSSLESCPNLVLHAAPGAGKTTRMPPALLRARFRGDGEILVLEPRRLAAKMAARRVAEELGEKVGEAVGYQFRFENVSSSRTRIRFLTEGMLIRRFLDDPELKGVAVVILDEFHERHLQGDLALAVLRRLQLGRRPELRIVVMSATLDSDLVAQYLGNCPVVRVEGRQFEVSIQYAAPSSLERGLEFSVRDAVVEALNRDSGHILVFLPGMAEIRRAEAVLRSIAATRNLRVLPLHGELTREEQDRAVGRSDLTKIILSTNVAETSLTIDGVTSVIDSGLARAASYSWWSGLPALRTRTISKASAIQRAGRAGRTQSGHCYRLYAKGDHDGRAAFEVPEIGRADLSGALLELKSLGVVDLSSFAWFESPPTQALESARAMLYKLGAVNGEGSITELGKRMSKMPAHPRLARLVLESDKLGILNEGAALAAMLSESRLETVDLLAEFRRYRPGEPARRIKERLVSSVFRSAQSPSSATLVRSSTVMGARTTDISSDRDDLLARAILSAYPDRVARKRTIGNLVARGLGRNLPQVELILASGGTAQMDDSALAASSDYFIAVDVEERKGGSTGRTHILVRAVCAVDAEWLFDLEPSLLEETDEIVWDPLKERVEAVSQLKHDGLILSESRGLAKDLVQAANALVEAALGTGRDFSRVCDREALSQVVQRLDFLRANSEALEFKEAVELPLLNSDFLVTKLKELAVGMTRLQELQDADFPSFLLSSLDLKLSRKLDQWVPLSLMLTRGRTVKINYEAGKPPWIESRLQDFFGMSQGPSVMGGRLPLTLHLLAPNYRAVQVTSDLAGFWTRVYPELRKELGRRYPRHAWPQDPMSPAAK